VPTRAIATAAAPSDAYVASAPAIASNYNWGYANPRDHIFDHPYDGWALNRGIVGLFPLGFWTRFAPMRGLASAITKVPEQRLHTYAVREKLMRVQGMTPDHARVLQLAYFNATQGQMPLHRNAPLTWLGQYGAPGDINDWVLRGPFILSLHTTAVQYGLSTYHTPAVPGNRELQSLAQHAAMIAPPVMHQPGYGPGPGPGYGPGPGMPPPPGYGGMPGYGADPITQIGQLIGTIGNLFR
jgi:hypothetical protein